MERSKLTKRIEDEKTKANEKIKELEYSLENALGEERQKLEEELE